MASWTSIPLKKTTIEIFRQKAKANDMTQDRYLMSLMSSGTNPNVKTYAYGSEDYTVLTDIAEFLFAKGMIDKPEATSATKFAIDNLVAGINKSIQVAKG